MSVDPRRAPAWVPAAVLAGVYLLVDPPSADLAAQEFRADLGLVVWDNAWYGGHHMPAYSVLFPPLAALLGPRLVGALAAVASAWLFERIVVERFGAEARVGALWFGAATATSLVTGRLTFALGVAVGLAAILAATRGRHGAACAWAALTSLASPVAGAFVALAAAAWWLARAGEVRSARRPAAGEGGTGTGRHTAPRERERGGGSGLAAPTALAASAVVPAAALSVAFPEGGDFPFVPSSFWPALAALAAVVLALPRDARVVRVGAVLYTLAMVASFAVDTPMGGNVVRLGALLSGPLLACLLWRRNRRMLALLAAPLLYWQWAAPVDDWVRAAADPSVRAEYYEGLLGFMRAQGGGPFRVEIPFTDNHWEARHVAPVVPLARGWERQLDRERNALFYDGRPLTPRRYRRWLDDNAVRFVALADAPVDYSAAAEAQLVRDGPAYLRPVWRDAHWRVFAVRGARPLADGTARATGLGRQRVDLLADRTGTTTLRVRFSPYWRLRAGDGCVERAPGDRLRVRVRQPGRMELETAFTPSRVFSRGPRCASR